MKRVKLATAVVLFVCCLVSCATVVPETKEPVDLKPSISMLFDSRPDNSEINVREVKTLDDITQNSAQYLKAWQLWETYAESLESYLVKLGDLSLFSL